MNIKEELTKKLDLLEEKISIMEKREADSKKIENLLHAFNKATLAMEKVMTMEETFNVLVKELKTLGFTCAIFFTDEEKTKLYPKYLAYDPFLVKAGEKLARIKIEDFAIFIKDVEVYRNVIWKRETVFVDRPELIIKKIMPDFAKSITRPLVKLFNIKGFILAPLVMEDNVIGMFSVQAEHLTEKDIPFITAFANQICATYLKTKLMSDLQDRVEELNKTQFQLLQAKKLEAIGTLAGGVAHDFNNILSAIIGYTEMTLEETALLSKAGYNLNQILKAGHRAKNLVKQILTFSEQTEIQKKPVEVTSVVKEALDMLRATLPAIIEIKQHIENHSVILADETQIHQVIINLCTNAAHSMKNNGGVIEVNLKEIEIRNKVLFNNLSPGTYLNITVKDTGHGMTPDIMERLFDPYFSTKKPGEGTGMGLAMVHGIIKSHNGAITVESKEEKGSTFNIFLPVVKEEIKQEREKEKPCRGNGERILFIDDEEDLAYIASVRLKKLGYHTVSVTGSIDALNIFEEEPYSFDLIITDQSMPKMNGLELTDRIMKIRPDIPVILCTGYSEYMNREKIAGTAIKEVITKPFDIEDLVLLIRKVLNCR